MHILKFGGTSMGDEHTWRKILNIIEGYDNPVIVVSATARTTRQLIAAAEEAKNDLENAYTIAQNIRKRHKSLVQNFLDTNTSADVQNITRICHDWIDRCITALRNALQQIAKNSSINLAQKDAIASIGEQLSAYLFARCGQACGLPTCWVDARNIIKTNADYGQALPDKTQIEKNIHRLSGVVDDHNIPIMGGFYGENAEGRITTLGFEGSDYTASLIGAALKAEAIEIWTDVSGIYTCDPRVVENAQPIKELSFQEATELAYFGAKILHPSTMKPAAAAGISVYVKNIFEPNHPGTKIHGSYSQNGPAKALTYLNDIVLLTVTAEATVEGHQFLAGVFDVLHSAGQPVNAVTTTEASVSVALQNSGRIKKLQDSLQPMGQVTLKEQQGLISLIGCAFDNMQAIQTHVLQGIGDVEPSLISYSESKQNLNIAVPETSLIPAVHRVHHLLFEK